MKLFSVLLLTCFSINSIAQILQKPTVEIDVRSGAFNTSLPFDETFNIKGELAYSTRKVILKYGPLDIAQEKKYYKSLTKYGKPSKSNNKIESIKEYFVKNGETEFEFSEIGPIRPNIAYKFDFLTLSKNNVSANQINLLKQEVDKKYATVLSTTQALNLQSMTDMYDDMIAVASEIIKNNELVDSSSEPFKIENYKKDLNLFSYRLLELHNHISSSTTKLNSIVDSTGETSLYYNFEQISPKIIAINSGAIQLSDYSKQALSSIMTGPAPIKGNVRQPVPYLQSALINKSGLIQTIFSEVGNINTPNTIDAVTIKNLIKIFDVLRLSEFNKIDKSKIFTYSEINSINNIINSLESILNYQNTLIQSTENLLALKNDVLNVLIKAYTDESYLLSSVAEVEVIPKYNPYVALDLGTGIIYNPYKNAEGTIGNNSYFSINEGVNVYFTPVNKRAPLSMFKWPYSFYKAFSIHVGLAQFLGGYNTYRFDNSIGGFFGNLVTGIGLRLNNTTKIGLNAVFVNMRNINPTISQSKLRPMYGLSFSFDVNIGKSLGSIGKNKRNN